MKSAKCMKTVLIASVFAALLVFTAGAGAAELPGKGVTVQPARCTWNTGFFQSTLVNRGLEELGYEVKKTKSLSNPMFYLAVTKREVDYWANAWFPLHNEQLPENSEEKTSVAGVLAPKAGLQGYLVSKDAVEKYDIKSLEDFKRPEVKKAFDGNDDGKADLVACPPGWGCEKVIAHHMDAYNLREHINPVKANYSASFSDALGRTKEGKPILFYTWTPNWTINLQKPGEDVLWINVPEIIPNEGQEGQEEFMVVEDVPGAVSSPLKMGFAANDICVYANNEFLDANPAAAEFFKQIKLSVLEIGAQNYKMHQGEDSEADIKRHVKEWIEENQEKWDTWLDKARKAGK
ncbi:MAG: glycine betaine/L-proline ABC transporter substrate-binding protein ProX [Desulfobacteraceae bacterium]